VTPSTTRAVLFLALLLVAGAAGVGCTDDGGNGAGTPGAAGTSGGGGTGGGAGAGGTSAGGSGGTDPNFMSVAPCTTESAYTAGTTVTFPLSATDFNYSPKCLKVSAGATVTFSGDFVTHPLAPSTHRGTLTANPITSTGTGTTKSFDFPAAGFYAYYCTVHGPSDGAAGMVGVVWVQ